jgi:hypothetical protein
MLFLFYTSILGTFTCITLLPSFVNMNLTVRIPWLAHEPVLIPLTRRLTMAET